MFQEEDLERIRTEWTAALETRQRHLVEQINRVRMEEWHLEGRGNSQMSRRHTDNHVESEREFSLMDQWVALTEERTAVSIPAPNSRIPGAPSDW